MRIKSIQVFMRGDTTASLSDEYESVKVSDGMLVVKFEQGEYMFPLCNLQEVRLLEDDE